MDTPVIDLKKYAADKAAGVNTPQPADNDPDEPSYKRYHIYHRYEDLEEAFFEVDGWMGVTPTFIAISKGPNDIQFVMPIDALKFAEVVDVEMDGVELTDDDPVSAA